MAIGGPSLLSVLLLCACSTSVNAELSESERDEIVSVHNDYRRTVAQGGVEDKTGNVLPPAGNMMRMQWDGKLAGQAQAWADECAIDHDANKPKGTGENLAWGSNKDLGDFIKKWYDEIAKKTYSGGAMPGKFAWPGMYDIGHFTQLAWAKTAKVGCGLTECNVQKARWFLVCRYADQGNMMHQSIYEESDSACGKCRDDCDDGLCTKLPALATAGGGKKCGAELGTDCPDWYCLAGKPFGKCTNKADGGVRIQW